MERLFFHLEQMTRLRTRGETEVALLVALHDLLDLHRASFHRLFMPPGDILVSLVARVDANGIERHGDGIARADDPVSIECRPHLQACLACHGARHDHDGGHARLTLPVPATGTPFGFVTLESARPLAADDPMIGGLIAVFDSHRRLLDYAEVDTLTGLLNRKTFDESVLRILSRLDTAGDAESGALHLPHRRLPQRQAAHHWLGVADIDHFKRINDDFGHLIGDEVLILLANMMRACFRTQDQLFRFGGEEFVVLLQPTEAANARLAFDRFRAAVEAFAFPQVGHVTVSIGFARIGAQDTPSMIFDSADEALYWAKGHGRNQVWSYEELLDSGRLQPRQLPVGEVELF